MPAEAGIQNHKNNACRFWMPAFAGMTTVKRGLNR